MSFSSQVKDELSRQFSQARHCQIAEIAAIINMCGRLKFDKETGISLKIHTENVSVARKYFTLLKKTFNIDTDVAIRRSVYLKKSRNYVITIQKEEDIVKVLKAIKLMDENGSLPSNDAMVSNLLLSNACCKRAFVRGAFLAAGSISAPEKFYHYEIVASSEDKAEQIKQCIHFFGIDAKIVSRKKYFVVYIKEGAQIVDVLNVMEAPKALMELENVRILKEMRNSVNRQVNCETANINKTVSAAVKQIEDIKFISDTMGLENLPESLEEIAKIRLENPEAPLKELGTYLSKPVGKSGVNHRLRKLSEIAEELRGN